MDGICNDAERPWPFLSEFTSKQLQSASGYVTQGSSELVKEPELKKPCDLGVGSEWMEFVNDGESP